MATLVNKHWIKKKDILEKRLNLNLLTDTDPQPCFTLCSWKPVVQDLNTD